MRGERESQSETEIERQGTVQRKERQRYTVRESIGNFALEEIFFLEAEFCYVALKNV